MMDKSVASAKIGLRPPPNLCRRGLKSIVSRVMEKPAKEGAPKIYEC
jgi:hypothetical protein